MQTDKPTAKPKDDENLSKTTLRFTKGQREKMERNGGSAWVRRLIDEAPESREPAEPQTPAAAEEANAPAPAPAIDWKAEPACASEYEAQQAAWIAYYSAIGRALGKEEASAAAAAAYAKTLSDYVVRNPAPKPEPEPQTDFLAEAKALGEAAYMQTLPDVTGTFQEVFKPDFEKAHAHLPEVRAARAYAKAFACAYAEGWADLWGALGDDAARDAQAVAKKEGLGPNLAFLIGFGVLELVRKAQAEAISPPAESEDL